MAKEKTLTLSQLYILPLFNMQALIAQTDVPIDDIDKMLLDQPVSRESAQKVLKTLSMITGEYHTFSNVKVKLADDSEGAL